MLASRDEDGDDGSDWPDLELLLGLDRDASGRPLDGGGGADESSDWSRELAGLLEPIVRGEADDGPDAPGARDASGWTMNLEGLSRLLEDDGPDSSRASWASGGGLMRSSDWLETGSSLGAMLGLSDTSLGPDGLPHHRRRRRAPPPASAPPVPPRDLEPDELPQAQGHEEHLRPVLEAAELRQGGEYRPVVDAEAPGFRQGPCCPSLVCAVSDVLCLACVRVSLVRRASFRVPVSPPPRPRSSRYLRQGLDWDAAGGPQDEDLMRHLRERDEPHSKCCGLCRKRFKESTWADHKAIRYGTPFLVDAGIGPRERQRPLRPRQEGVLQPVPPPRPRRDLHKALGRPRRHP